MSGMKIVVAELEHHSVLKKKKKSGDGFAYTTDAPPDLNLDCHKVAENSENDRHGLSGKHHPWLFKILSAIAYCLVHFQHPCYYYLLM